MLPILSANAMRADALATSRVNQGISRHGIEQISRNIPSLTSEELQVTFLNVLMYFDSNSTALTFIVEVSN